MKQCPNCRCQVGTGIAVCPYCGTELPPDEYYQQNHSGKQRTTQVRRPTKIPVSSYNTQPVYSGNTQKRTETMNQNAGNGMATDLSGLSYPMSTVKTSSTAYASGSIQPDYGSYTYYPVQEQPVYYERMSAAPVTYPVYPQSWQAMPAVEEERNSNLNLILAILLIFMGFTVLELIILLIVLLK